MRSDSIKHRAAEILALLATVMGNAPRGTGFDNLRAEAAGLRESAQHLLDGAPDPVCPDCAAAPPPEEGFEYPDECPCCGSDEYALFTRASSLECAADQFRRAALANGCAMAEPDKIVGLVDDIVGEGGIEGAIATVRNENEEE